MERVCSTVLDGFRTYQSLQVIRLSLLSDLGKMNAYVEKVDEYLAKSGVVQDKVNLVRAK